MKIRKKTGASVLDAPASDSDSEEVDGEERQKKTEPSPPPSPLSPKLDKGEGGWRAARERGADRTSVVCRGVVRERYLAAKRA